MNQREIKFRAWIGNEMVYWGFVDGGFISPPASLGTGQNAFNVPQMQFTGLHDKNGNEIYEGDLIECYTTSGDKVYTYPHEVKLPDFYREIWSSRLEKYLPAELGERTKVLVVGNIYENPELLK